MTVGIFSPAMDREIEEMIRDRCSWAEIGRKLECDPRVIRQRVERTLKRHDLVEIARARREGRDADTGVQHGTPRPWGGEALPPGHSATWGAITRGTCLEGEPYPVGRTDV